MTGPGETKAPMPWKTLEVARPRRNPLKAATMSPVKRRRSLTEAPAAHLAMDPMLRRAIPNAIAMTKRNLRRSS